MIVLVAADRMALKLLRTPPTLPYITIGEVRGRRGVDELLSSVAAKGAPKILAAFQI